MHGPKTPTFFTVWDQSYLNQSFSGLKVEHMFATGSSGSHELAVSEMMKGDEKNRNICPLSKQQVIQFMVCTPARMHHKRKYKVKWHYHCTV